MISARFTYDGGHFSDRFVVVGHCCESGDLMTPVPGEPSVLAPRALGGEAQIGDLLVVDGSGACVGGRSSHLGSARQGWLSSAGLAGARRYCSSMCTKNYNSFPEAPKVMLAVDGSLHLIHKRQPVEEIWANEVLFKPA